MKEMYEFREELIENIEKYTDIIYKCGYDNGYQKGLEDAWEFMIKIVDDNFEMDELKTVFGTCNIYYILKRNTPSEAMQKIKEHEERQTRYDIEKVYDPIEGAERYTFILKKEQQTEDK